MQIILFYLFNFLIFNRMKKFYLFVLTAALALPMMAQIATTKAECMRPTDRSVVEKFAPVKAFDASNRQVVNMNRGGYYLWDFETDESLEGWMTFDADGDGYAWEIDNYYSYNGGTYSLTSRSYYGGALDPDNWLFSPIVPLDGPLTIHAMNYLSSYPDKFMVYICVGDPFADEEFNEEDFVPISEFITPSTSWDEYTFDLSAYEGAMGCFAIRHYDCYDMFRVLVDYISLGYPVPVATTPEDVTVDPGQTEAAVMWTDEDDTMWNLRYREYTESGYFWDFEEEAAYDYSLPGGWTCIDADGDGYEWYHLNQSGGFQTHSGYGHLTSASYANYSGLYPDNWLISPEVTLTNSLVFWACGQDPSYAAEHFTVYVTTGDPNDLSSYVAISEEIEANGSMTEYMFDLSAFEGMTGHVAIRHHNTYDMFRLNIDDVQIGNITEEAEWIYIYDLTDTNYLIEGLFEDTTYEVQVQATNEDGGDSAWTESTLFTTKTKTGINELVTNKKNDNIYYNLMGQKMNPANLPAGIYIHNGKKIIVK